MEQKLRRKVLTLTDDQFISALISRTWLLLPVEAVRVHLVFTHCFCVLSQFVFTLLVNVTVRLVPADDLQDVLIGRPQTCDLTVVTLQISQ